jgi:hypothetical protein
VAANFTKYYFPAVIQWFTPPTHGVSGSESSRIRDNSVAEHPNSHEFGYFPDWFFVAECAGQLKVSAGKIHCFSTALTQLAPFLHLPFSQTIPPHHQILKFAHYILSVFSP